MDVEMSPGPEAPPPTAARRDTRSPAATATVLTRSLALLAALARVAVTALATPFTMTVKTVEAPPAAVFAHARKSRMVPAAGVTQKATSVVRAAAHPEGK